MTNLLPTLAPILAGTRPPSSLTDHVAMLRDQWRADGETHLFNPLTIHTLQRAVRTGDYARFKDYSALVDGAADTLPEEALRYIGRWRPMSSEAPGSR